MLWRFRAERRGSHPPHRAEARARFVVAAALGTVSVVLTLTGVGALVTASHPGHSTLSLVTAAVSMAVLAPLGIAKRRVGANLPSRALRGDGSPSTIGAVVAALALTGLWLDGQFGWWWADGAAGLLVAGIAAGEAARVLTEEA